MGKVSEIAPLYGTLPHTLHSKVSLLDGFVVACTCAVIADLDLKFHSRSSVKPYFDNSCHWLLAFCEGSHCKQSLQILATRCNGDWYLF